MVARPVLARLSPIMSLSAAFLASSFLAAYLALGAEASASEPEPKASRLELTFVGDVIFGRYREHGFDPIPENGFPLFEDVKTALASDYLVGNLETPLVRDLPLTSPIHSRFRFGGSPEFARLLVEAGFSAMSLANNHWYDLRALGVEQTPAVLRELGILPLGSAAVGNDRFRIESTVVQGVRLGFVAISTRTNAPIRETAPSLPYLATNDVAEIVSPLLRKARADHDLLIVLVHWGDEYAEAPSRTQTRAAHALVDAGADLVIGHHPHVLQGFELYEGHLIAYSLGNFLFENTNPPSHLTGVLRVAVTGEGCLTAVRFHPAVIRRSPTPHPVVATGTTEVAAKARVRALSRPWQVEWADDGHDLTLTPTGSCESP